MMLFTLLVGRGTPAGDTLAESAATCSKRLVRA